MFRLLSLLAVVSFSTGALIDPALQRSLRSADGVNIFVTMKAGTKTVLNGIQSMEFQSRTQRITSLRAALIENAKHSQQPVMALLQQRYNSFRYESFWISNNIFIENATSELIDALSQLESVEEIHQEHIIDIEPIVEEEVNTTRINNVEWGVNTVKAPEVWADGNTGAGVVVGIIDTGCRGTHEALKDSYVGNDKFGFYDPYNNNVDPMDSNGHGTHVMGTILGSNGIGVAKGAKWMACRGCSTSTCTEKALTACGQFICCPHDAYGNNADCSLAPRISSNSWGGRSNDKWYLSIVESWHAASIVPVFAQGNSGSSCSSANSPGDYANVIGVGATTSSNGLASFSSVGPAVGSGIVKPDVSSPGYQIRSAWMNSDTGYRTISGTSMACPHVAGVIALMISKDPSLTYDQIYKLITGTTTKKCQQTGKNCGGVSEDGFPNNAFGWGITNAKDACDAIDGDYPEPTPSPDYPTPSPDYPEPTPSPEPEQCKFDILQWACVRESQCKWCLWNCQECY